MNPVPELRDLVAKYKTSGPRYTSYPTALQFSSMSPSVASEHVARAARRVDEPWSIYVHVPFCQQRCSFCACAVVATPHHDRVAPPYIEALQGELALLDPLLGRRRGVAQLHLGGGTPTYLEPEFLRTLYRSLARHFQFAGDMESSLELDPRVTRPEHLDVLAEVGVNRVSLGVQDLDAHVQSLIGRHQSEAQTRGLVQGARARGIDAINIDLVYGLPGQTEVGLLRTVDAIAAMAPQRVALYGYAHVPWMRGNQRSIDPAALPEAAARLSMFLAARERFEQAGYLAIGLDHFALPDDPLAMAERAGTLKRNFMGYTVSSGTDLLGLGVTAIGDIGGALIQNATQLAVYERRVAQGQLPVEKGVVRTWQDMLRHHVISSLMCRHSVNKDEVEAKFAFDGFDQFFELELSQLREFIDDGVVEVSDDALRITELGRPFVRNVAMAFDAYISPGSEAKRHSATV